MGDGFRSGLSAFEVMAKMQANNGVFDPILGVNFVVIFNE